MRSRARESGVWVYKVNRNDQEFATAKGDWGEFFDRRRESCWGGSWSTNNNVSLSILNKRMKVRDLVLAYQTDDRCLIGTCRVTRLIGTHPDREIWLKPVDRFDTPIPVHDLKQHSPLLRGVRAFSGRQFPQTLYEVSVHERRILESVCQIHLPADEEDAPVLPQQRRSGAGFGDAASNRLVEAAAVNAAQRWYRRRGWTVRSVEASKCGYDLRCRRKGVSEHVEVKGVAGDTPRFIITIAEKRQSETNDHFVICVVTRARSERPVIRRLTGKQFRRNFSFQPLQFIAEPIA